VLKPFVVIETVEVFFFQYKPRRYIIIAEVTVGRSPSGNNSLDGKPDAQQRYGSVLK
jgi:hypothetical protein